MPEEREEAGGDEVADDAGSRPASPGPRDGGPELPPRMRRFLRRGLLLYPFAAGGLWLLSGLGFWDALFLVALLELLPVLAVAQVPLAVREEIDRPVAYVGSAAAILVLGALALILGLRTVGTEGMGLGTASGSAFLLWTGVALAGGLGLVLLSLAAEKLFDIEESDFVRKIIPRTPYEKALFVGVSLAAGIGEELAYRGYAIPVLAGLVGSEWTAAVLTSGIFGFLHAYQGQIGVVRTALMGLVLAAVFLWSGSLWPAVAAHVIIDLVGGLVLGPRMVENS